MVRFESGVLTLTLKILLLAFTIAGVLDVARLHWYVPQPKLSANTVPTIELKIGCLEWLYLKIKQKHVFGVRIVKLICAEVVSLHFTQNHNISKVKNYM